MRSAEVLEEAELVQRLMRGGDEGAFEVLFGRYIDQAVRAAYLVTRSQQAAEDAAQDAFLQVLRKVHSLRDPARFQSWFYSLLLNSARGASRKGRKWRFLLFQAVGYELADTMTPGPHETVEADEEMDALRRGLRRIAAPHREVLVLRYYSELTEPEIADALGIPLGTVKSRLNKARGKLREQLGEERRSHEDGVE